MGLTLTLLVTGLSLVDHVDTTTTADNLVIRAELFN